MVRFRLTTALAFSVILLCSIYWLYKAATPTPAYTSLLQTHLQKSNQEEAVTRQGFYEQTRQYGVDADSGLHNDDFDTLDHEQEDAKKQDGNSHVADTTHITVKPSAKPDASQQIDSPLLPQGYSAAFPRHIWQTSSMAGKEKYATNAQTWKKIQGFEYHWMSDEDADEFVHRVFSATRPSLVAFWDDLSATIQDTSNTAPIKPVKTTNNTTQIIVDSTASSSIVLRADLLRYMLMSVHGGVYADIDTSALIHVDRWIPNNLGSQVINAIIGIEYDDTTKAMFVRPISFCQWTLMSKPNHPIFTRAIDRVVSNLEFLARRQRVQSLSQLKLDKLDVLEATGPGMISDVVLEVIRDQMPDGNITWDTFHGQKEAKLFGDVLILPINGFAGSQKHSHAGDPEYGPLLVAHHFGRSWYRPAVAKPVAGT